MSESTKICVMCRKEVDSGAMLCPYCKSSIDYSYFVAIPCDKVDRKTNLSKKHMQALFVILAVIGGFGLGFTFGGIWIGVGGSILMGKACLFLVSESPYDTYHYQFCCPKCSKEENIIWNAVKFDELKRGIMECTGCKNKSMLIMS